MRRYLNGGLSGQGESQLIRDKSRDQVVALVLTCSYGIPQRITVPKTLRLAASTLPINGE